MLMTKNICDAIYYIHSTNDQQTSSLQLMIFNIQQMNAFCNMYLISAGS